MRPLVAVVGARFRLLLQYRAAAFAAICTQIAFGWIFVSVYAAFYAGGAADLPMTYAEVVTYVWLGQALLATIPWNGDAEVCDLVRSGGVAYEMLRPVDLYAFWYARAVALRTAPTLLRAVPLTIAALLFFDMGIPPSAAHGAAFAAVLAGAIALSAAITVLVSVSLLWTVSGEGVLQLLPGVVVILSGHLVPLPMFPGWARTVLEALPLRGIVDLPYRVYLGHIPLDRVPGEMAVQWLWVALLVLLGRWLLARGLRRMVVQGG